MANRGSNRQRNEWTVDLLEIAPTDRVLELGCGPGLALAAAAQRAALGRVVGLDHSEVMIGQARARLDKLGLRDRVELRLGGVEALQSLSGPFDKILSVNLVQFVPEKAQLFAATHGLLAPGGSIATAYQPRHRRDGGRRAPHRRGAGPADGTGGIPTDPHRGAAAQARTCGLRAGNAAGLSSRGAG